MGSDLTTKGQKGQVTHRNEQVMISMRSGNGQWLVVNNTGLQGRRKALYILLQYNNMSRHYTFAVDAHVLLSPKGCIIYGMANENE